MFGLCFGMHYFVSFPVLRIESFSFYILNCIPDVLFLLMFCGSSSQCHGSTVCNCGIS